jgi:benzoyl-CoA reductase/2-hydroxyglutaryl-CoA dehydratase subunit BcrC/BadD/HgdB
MSDLRVPIETTAKMMQLMAGYYMGAKMAEGTDRKIAWVTSGAPVELLYAADVIPIYPENHAALCGAQKMAVALCEAAEERGFSRDLCSYARTDFGSIYTQGGPMGGLPKPDFLLCCNNICGTVTKWYQNLQRHFGVPLLFLDTPFVHGAVEPAAIDYVRAQLEAILEAVGELTGQPVTQEKLYESLLLSARAIELWREILDLPAHQPSPMTSFDTFIHLAPIVVLRGTQQCVDYYQMLLAEIQQRVANGIAAVPGERFRLGWDNLPIWFKMGSLSKRFAEHKACLVAATYANAWAHMVDPNAQGDLLREVARSYLTVYINCGLEERVRTLQSAAAKFGLDGFVLHSNRSCKAYSLGQYELARTLTDELHIPTLLIEADMNDARVYAEEQVHARIDAFMETLANRGR